jgi:hypothetical protein
MPGEDASAYEDLRQGMHDAYQPANEPERVLVEQIAANSWRLMRAQRVETAFLNKLAEGSGNPDEAIAVALLERPKDLARLCRYVTSATNAYYKAMNELAKLQKARAAAEREAAADESEFAFDPRFEVPFGFVSQSPEQSFPAVPESQPPVNTPRRN